MRKEGGLHLVYMGVKFLTMQLQPAIVSWRMPSTAATGSKGINKIGYLVNLLLK